MAPTFVMVYEGTVLHVHKITVCSYQSGNLWHSSTTTAFKLRPYCDSSRDWPFLVLKIGSGWVIRIWTSPLKMGPKSSVVCVLPCKN